MGRRYDEKHIGDTAWLIDRLHDLGGINLDRTRRTIGFERRPLRADQRPRAGASWGEAPRERNRVPDRDWLDHKQDDD